MDFRNFFCAYFQSSKSAVEGHNFQTSLTRATMFILKNNHSYMKTLCTDKSQYNVSFLEFSNFCNGDLKITENSVIFLSRAIWFCLILLVMVKMVALWLRSIIWLRRFGFYQCCQNKCCILSWFCDLIVKSLKNQWFLIFGQIKHRADT